jgi:hypothetical protein
MIHFDLLKPMLHSPVRNYALKGLTSYLLGEPSKDHGLVRIFQMQEKQQVQITPHSHKYDLHCLVLRGEVVNTIWTRSQKGFDCKVTPMAGTLGEYETVASYPEKWDFRQFHYSFGMSYFMEAEEVHSITFSKGAVVLLFEGPARAQSTLLVEPEVSFNPPFVPFSVEPWMFLKE